MAASNVNDIFRPTGLYALRSEQLDPPEQWPDPKSMLIQTRKKLELLAWDEQLKTEWIPTRRNANRDIMIILEDRSGKRNKKTYSKHFDCVELLTSFKSPETIARSILNQMHVEPIGKEPKSE